MGRNGALWLSQLRARGHGLVEGEAQRKQLEPLLAAVHQRLVRGAEEKRAFHFLASREHGMENNVVMKLCK